MIYILLHQTTPNYTVFPFHLLTDLENTYENNQKVLEDKAKQLVELEETVRSLLQTISQKVAVYSTCL